jgi:type I restriction enzyme S subunit
MAERLIAKLGELCTIEKGETGIASAMPGEFPLVTTSPTRKTCATWQFDAEAVCIPLVSSTGHGKKTLNYVHFQSGKFALGTILAAVIPKNPKQLSAAYIHRYLQFHKNAKLVSLMKGAANVSLAVRDIAKVEIEIPSIEVQNRFVLLYDEAERFAKQLGTEFELQEQAIQSLRSSLLQEAIEGRLSADWRAKQPFKKGDPERDGASLFEAIREEKKKLVAAGKIRKEKPLEPIGKGEEPFRLPEGWVWTRLGEICDFITKGTTPSTTELRPNGEIPYLKVYNLVDQKIDFYYKPQFISMKIHEKLARSKVYPGDVLMNIVGPPLGKVAIVPTYFPEWHINQALAIFRCLKPEVNPFIYLFLNEGSGVDSVQTLGVVGQDNISLTQCRDMIFPLPPLAEQAFIVERVEALLARVDELEKEIAARRALTEELMREVLREAFA